MPLLHERDVYLAWSLTRSKAVNGCSIVVGIVGALIAAGSPAALLSCLGCKGVYMRSHAWLGDAPRPDGSDLECT